MLLILISIIALTALGVWGSHGSSWSYSFFSDCFAPTLAGVGMILLVVYALCGWSYFAAEHKAAIMNREYGTNYTQIEVFYASDVIETIRHLNRKRFEVNGNLLKDFAGQNNE